MTSLLAVSTVRPRIDSWVRARTGLLWLVACTAVYAIGATAVATKVYGLLNHDAVSYLMLARHWLEGRADLAVTGTWSPLLPWCLALALAVAVSDDLAVRLVMGLSGFVFLAGSCFFYVRQPSATVAWIAGLLTALAAAAHTGVLTTPDLLGGGLFLAGFGLLLDAFERASVRLGIASGAVLGLAYLAKAIFLPLALASCGVVLILRAWRRRRAPGAAPATGSERATVMAVGIAWLIVTAPWITALSVKYGTPTYTRATIPQWSVIGPRDVPRNQPTNIRFYVPEPGRQSQFEDESILPVTSWSPLENRAYLMHYLGHIRTNVVDIQPALLRRIDVLNGGFLALLVFFAARAGRRVDGARAFAVAGPWPWLAVPSLLLLGAYAANFGDQLRYYLVAVPGIFLGALVAWPCVGAAVAGTQGRIAGLAVASVSLLLPITALRADFLDWTHEGKASAQARVLAHELAAAGLRGDVATVGLQKFKLPAVYLSYRLGTAYHGTEDAQTIDEVERACARLLVLEAGNPMADSLLAGGRHVRVEELTARVAEELRMARLVVLWRTGPVDEAACRRSTGQR